MENDNLKPLTVRKNEYVGAIVDLTNNSGLPLFVVEYLLRDLLNEVHLASQKQEKDELLGYNNVQKRDSSIVEDNSSDG